MSTFNGIIHGVQWIDLGISAAELRLNNTFTMAQCNSCDNFNWKSIDVTDEKGIVSSCWIGMLDSQALAIRQTDTTTLFANLLTSNSSILNNNRRNELEIGQLLRGYFQTGHNLEALYVNWNESCERMKVVNECLKGVRVLRQDPFECLVSFICSTNNNVKRISLMLDRLRCRYGRYVCTVEPSTDVSSKSKVSTDCWCVSYEVDNGQSVRKNLARALCIKEEESSIERECIVNKEIDSKSFQSPQIITKKRLVKTKGTPYVQESPPLKHHLFEFPTIESLALATEIELMALGMGYRAKFISNTASLLAGKEGGGRAWLNNLRDMGDSRGLNMKAGIPNPKTRLVRTLQGGCVKEEKVIRGVKRVRNGCIKEESGVIEMEMENTDRIEGSSRLLVKNFLMEFPGVGPKVADCVALFSLDQTGSIFVDKPVWQIAVRDYDPLSTIRNTKSINPMVYEQVGAVFRGQFPDKAGWAMYFNRCYEVGIIER